MQETTSRTTSHVRASEHVMSKIIITIVPSYLWKENGIQQQNASWRVRTGLLPLALLLVLCTRDNTDGNKLVIFSGIALYYGDTYVIL